MDDIVKEDDVFVAELLHKRDLADRGTGRPLFRVEVDLLEGYELSSLPIAAFKNLRSISTGNSRRKRMYRTVA